MLNSDQQESFTRRWTDAQPSVSRYVASVISDSASAKDIVQATALVLLRKYPEYDEQRPFLPWALGVAKFEILGHRRDAARSKIIFDSDFLDRYTETWTELATAHDETEAEHLRACLDQLPEKQLRLIRLRYFESMNSKEIGERLRLTSANVRTQLKRTRSALQDCILERLRLNERGML